MNQRPTEAGKQQEEGNIAFELAPWLQIAIDLCLWPFTNNIASVPSCDKPCDMQMATRRKASFSGVLIFQIRHRSSESRPCSRGQHLMHWCPLLEDPPKPQTHRQTGKLLERSGIQVSLCYMQVAHRA